MSKIELLKKYWFLGIVCIALLIFVGFYAKQTYDNREITVDTLKDNGKYVVFSFDGDNYTADDLYETLYKKNYQGCMYNALQKSVLNAAYKTTNEISESASNYAQSLLYMASTGQYSYSEEDIYADLASMGYEGSIEGLKDYYVVSIKQDLLNKDFFTEKYDKYFGNIDTDYKPKKVYHILVKTENKCTKSTDEEGNTIYIADPTEQETAKLNEILAKLKDGATVKELAKDYSDDTSNVNEGYVGFIYNGGKSNFVETFQKAAEALEYGETSEAIVSEYGYHIIYVEKPTKEEILDNASFLSSVLASSIEAQLECINWAGENTGLVIENEDLKALLKAPSSDNESEDQE